MNLSDIISRAESLARDPSQRSPNLTPRCAKCGETNSIHRHHLGCEAMWLNHFSAKSKTKLYKAYKARYKSFNEADIVRLCADCHQLIHVIYLQQINRMVAEDGFRKLSEWSWAEARGMMKVLRKVGRMWIAGKL